MKRNWNLILVDILLIITLCFTIYYWNSLDNFKKFISALIIGAALIRQVYKHGSFYKRDRRLY